MLAALPREWARVAAPLYGARAARVLHLAAAATALGVIAGLYTRGLAFEYRASWESTFLGAEQVHALLSVTLAPGSWLTGIPVPDVAAIEAIRAPASENAAMWMHLMAGTVAVVVIIPRLVLAIVAGLVERRRAKNVALPLDEPYYRRLVAGWVGEPTRVRVIPYSYTLTPEARAGLEAILARAYGNAAATIDAPVGWGDDEWLSPATDAAGTGSIDAVEIRLPLFSLTATPEDVAHGEFLDALRAGGGRAAASGPTVVLVDESAFLARWGDDAARREERRAVWRELVEAHGGVPVFVDLADPDLAAAEAQLADAASAHDGDARRPTRGGDERARGIRSARPGPGSRYGCFAAYSTADDPGPRRRRRLALAHLAHQRGQDDARAHAARARRRRGARRPARHRRGDAVPARADARRRPAHAVGHPGLRRQRATRAPAAAGP